MESIDAILYINLAHRTERKEHILLELQKWGVDSSKIHRVDAVHRTPGALGCGLSHIKALTEAFSHPEWNTVLVLEDDFTFHSDYSEINDKIKHLITSHRFFDIGLLSYNSDYIKYTDTTFPSIKKVVYSQTTSSYIIRRHYIPTLVQNMKGAMYDMERFGKRHENCIDIHWTRLQPNGRWYAIFPAIGYQYENYSDIENRVTSYGC
jgi:GR25 family glycosyltransferase involved in LPS biosynthesis